MNLSMQSHDQHAQDLPLGDESMTTGDMGDCVSIIVLWNFQDGRALQVRGFHGFGGFGEINLDSLFANVPNNAHTIIHAFYGIVAQAGHDRERVTAAMVQRMAAAVTTHHNLSNATVTRRNAVAAAVGAPALRKKTCVIL